MSDVNPVRPAAGGGQVLHRPLDVQGHAEPVLKTTVVSINETYQDASGQHLWTLKRFPGVPSAEPSSDINPEEVE
ncbi:hypothetical protein [Arthrobacter sp. cf158]|uniref:hypothetical protein n=1 Tax=Arthrobacter sp. cf158 TaxID=1761744 RepID=UPI000B85E902|nr:hypothetical protein [Arthrobacter sp. cf158]